MGVRQWAVRVSQSAFTTTDLLDYTAICQNAATLGRTTAS